MFPKVPGDKASVYKDRLIYAVVSDALEEDPPSEQGELERVDVDISAIVVPCISSYPVR